MKKANRAAVIPDGFKAEDIRIESGICTGERTIGFYSPSDKKLHYAELVRSGADILNFYRKYGIQDSCPTTITKR